MGLLRTRSPIRDPIEVAGIEIYDVDGADVHNTEFKDAEHVELPERLTPGLRQWIVDSFADHTDELWSVERELGNGWKAQMTYFGDISDGSSVLSMGIERADSVEPRALPRLRRAVHLLMAMERTGRIWHGPALTRLRSIARARHPTA